ncbi:MAG TPA: hypothetical protein VGM92_00350, partial [Candidatus Kapabacteria bacterium]
MTRPDDPLRIPIAIRAYTESPNKEPVGTLASADITASPWTVVFDTETAIDAAQRFRFGFYQIRYRDCLREEGIFYDDNTIPADEEMQIRDFARSRNLALLTVAEFRTDVFLKYGYTRGGTIVGFNLPFDISRIAIRHSPARRSMRGGFSFELTRNADDPRVRIKHLSPKSAIIDFAKPGEQDTPRGMRKRGFRVPVNRGHFVDCKTTAAALLSRRFSLRSLSACLGTPTQKHNTDEHGSLSADYLDYARADTQVTWECYINLHGRYAAHHLSRPIDRLLSEASIGKAYIQAMGIKPFLGCNPQFPRKYFGEIFSAFYGGRAEVRNRRVIREVTYCDFKSMYPTVNSLMGLWEFVIADGLVIEETTAKTQAFLAKVTLTDLQRPECWKKLCTLVRITPDEDIFPVRAAYNGLTNTIGLNRLTAPSPLWLTLADCIVSKLLTGRCPRIEKAQTYHPGPRQSELAAIRILGKSDFTIDPNTDDFFTRLI